MLEVQVDSRAFKRRESVVRREVAGETFLVPIHGHLADLQELFVLNEVGSWLWERLDGERSLDDLAAGLRTEFEVDEAQALGDTELFVQRLVEGGLADQSQPGPA
jgi:hypothetical protein